MSGIPIGRTENSSPAPTSPTPPSLCREAMHTPLQAAHIYANYDDSAYSSSHGLLSSSHALPSIFGNDDHDQKMTQGKLPPLITDPVSIGGRKDLPQDNPKRSHQIVHRDTSRSSLTPRSSLSSQFSEASTVSSYGGYTPMTPLEESRGQRLLPAPQSMSMAAPFGGKVVDRTQNQPLQPHAPALVPSSYTPSHPLQSPYHPPSGSSGTDVSFLELSPQCRYCTHCLPKVR